MNDPIKKIKSEKPDCRFHVHATKALIDRLNEVCRESKVGRSALIVELIKEFLKTKTESEGTK